MMSFSRGSIAAYMGLVFVSGAAVGALGNRLYTVSSVTATKTVESPENMRKRFVGDMQTRLKLADDQVMKLNLILDESRGRFHEVQAKTKPELDAIRKEQVDNIRAILSEQQRTEYDRWLKEREEKRKHSGPRQGPGF